MSIILKALEKAQKKYSQNVKAVLTRNQTADKGGVSEPGSAIDPAQPQVHTAVAHDVERSSFKINVTAVAFGLIFVFLVAITFVLNNRITSRINVTNGQMADLVEHVKNQEQKVAELNDNIRRLEKASVAQTQEFNSSLEKLNGDIVQKIGNLKGEFNNQKAVWDNAITEQGQAVTKTREMLDTYKADNKTLKDQIDSIKEKVDAIINVPTQ
jgi:SMC interacting uncharacterized protein involved in chromosome segregation